MHATAAPLEITSLSSSSPLEGGEPGVQGVYIVGGKYRVRYVADSTGFHARVEFITAEEDDAIAAVAVKTPGTDTKIKASKPTASSAGQAQKIAQTKKPQSTQASNDDADVQDDEYDDDDNNDDDNVDVDFVPPVVQSSRPPKPQDQDGIGCSIRNSLCGK